MAFDPVAAQEQFARGLRPDRRSTQSWGWEAWSETWRVDGQLEPGSLGEDGGRWWFDALTDPAWLDGELPDVPKEEPLTSESATARLRRFVQAADARLTAWPKAAFAPAVFALREAIGPVAALRVFFTVLGPVPELVESVGPIDETDAAVIVETLQRPGLLVAIGADHTALALDRLTDLEAWAEARMLVGRLPIEARAAWLVEHRQPPSVADLSDALDDVDDETFSALIERALSRRDRRVWDIASQRPLASLLPVLLRWVDDPMAPWVQQWLTAADNDVLEKLVDIATETTTRGDRARKALGMLDRTRRRLLVSMRVGTEIDSPLDELLNEPSFPELPRSETPRWLETIVDHTPTSRDWLRPQHLGPLVTNSGHRLPTGARNGMLALLQDVRLESDPRGERRDRYDAVLDAATELLGPESGAFWDMLYAQWWTNGADPDDRWVLAAAAFIAGPTQIQSLSARLVHHRKWFGDAAPTVIEALARHRGPWAIATLADLVFRRRSPFAQRARHAVDAAAQRAGKTFDAFIESNLPAEPHPLVYRVLSAHFERALRHYRSWPADHWVRLASHPVFDDVAKTLLWTADTPFAGDKPLRWDGEWLDADERTVELDDSTSVRLAHPAELPDAAFQAWSALFVDYEIVQPFDQLSRPRFRAHSLSRDRFKSPVGIRVDGRPVVRASAQLGWETTHSGAHHRIVGIERSWPDLDLRATIHFEEPLDADGSGSTHVAAIGFTTAAGDALDGIDVPPAIFSDVHADAMQLFIQH